MNKQIILNDHTGHISYHDNFLNDQKYFLEKLLQEIPFAHEHLKIYGRNIQVPRLVSWHGDAGIEYKYSGKNHIALPWTNTLLELKKLIELNTNEQFNSVLLNLYRNGNDYMSWHADDEKELGINPTIASLSLGTERIFEFKLRSEKKAKYVQLLNSGSLLIMSGNLQNNYHHRIKKEAKIKGLRINLTFRKIIN